MKWWRIVLDEAPTPATTQRLRFYISAMVPVRTDWTGIPAATAKATPVKHQSIFKHLKRRKAAIKATFLCMVPVGGLEPPRPKATDFESVVYTNFTTPASRTSRPLMFGIIRKPSVRASAKD